MPKSDNQLIRDPGDWARDWGWVSRRRASNIARKLNELAWQMDNTMDEGAASWAKDIRRIAKTLAPEKLPVEKKRVARGPENECRAVSLDGSKECALPRGHSGRHQRGAARWANIVTVREP